MTEELFVNLKRVKMLFAILAMTLLSNCGEMMGNGSDAGCQAYREARLTMPPAESILDVPSQWRGWISSMDTRMTGTCT